MAESPLAVEWPRSRTARTVLGACIGVGAPGVSAGLGVIGRVLGVTAAPVSDVSGLILTAPLVAIGLLAGMALRGPAALFAVMAGAFAAPIASIFAMDGSCEGNMFAAIGLVSAAAYATTITGVAALVGDRLADRSTRIRDHRALAAVGLIGATVVGVVGWAAWLATVGSCP